MGGLINWGAVGTPAPAAPQTPQFSGSRVNWGALNAQALAAPKPFNLGSIKDVPTLNKALKAGQINQGQWMQQFKQIQPKGPTVGSYNLKDFLGNATHQAARVSSDVSGGTVNQFAKAVVNAPLAVAREAQNKPITDIQQNTFGTTKPGAIAKKIIGSTAGTATMFLGGGEAKATTAGAKELLSKGTAAGAKRFGVQATKNAAIGSVGNTASSITTNPNASTKQLFKSAGTGAVVGTGATAAGTVLGSALNKARGLVSPPKSAFDNHVLPAEAPSPAEAKTPLPKQATSGTAPESPKSTAGQGSVQKANMNEVGGVAPGQVVKDTQAMIAKHNQVVNATGNIAEDSQKLAGRTADIKLDVAKVLKNRAPLSNADKQTLLDYRDAKGAGLTPSPLPAHLQAADKNITALNKAAQAADVEKAKLSDQPEKAAQIAARDPETYTHRIAQGKGSNLEYAVRGDRQNPLSIGSLSKTTAGSKKQVYMSATDEAGNRHIVAVKPENGVPKVTAITNAGKTSQEIGSVKKPLVKKVDEFYDKNVRDALSQTAKNLNINVEKTVSRRGNYAGKSLTGRHTIVLKAGAPSRTMLHEIGHQLDEKYHLQEQFVGNKAYRQELRDLTDLRTGKTPEEVNSVKISGTDPASELGNTQKQYIQSYADMLKEQESGLKGGKMQRSSEGGFIRTSEHSPFYRQFYEDNGKAPTKLDWFNQARKELENGKGTYGASDEYKTIPEKKVGTPSQATPAFSKYVRKGEEKVATMFEAYIHNPQLFKEVAPKTFSGFEKFLKAHPETKPITEIKPSLVLGKETIASGPDLLPKEFIAKDGKKYTLGQATTSEITKNTGQKYYVDPELTSHLNYADSKVSLENTRFVEGTKKILEDNNIAIKQGETAPKHYQTTTNPYFAGYKLQPKVAEVLDDITAGKKSTGGKLLAASSRVLRNTIIYLPIRHDFNMGAGFIVDRGLTGWLNPVAYGRMGKALITATKEVATQGPLYRQMLREGSPLVTADDKELAKVVQKQVRSMSSNSDKVAQFAKSFGMSPVRAYQAIQHVTVWDVQDILNIARVHERMQGTLFGGKMSFDEALKDTAKYNFQYQVPSRVAGSRVASELLQGKTPLTYFGKYTYDKFRIAKNILKNTANVSNPKQAFRAADKLAAAVAISALLWPEVDKGLQAVTGNKNAHITAPGVTSLPEIVQKVLQGQKGITAAAGSQISVALPITVATQLHDNTDSFTGKRIWDVNTTTGQKSKAISSWLETQLPPAQKLKSGQNATQNKGLSVALSLAGASTPKNSPQSNKVKSLANDSLPMAQDKAKAAAKGGNLSQAQQILTDYNNRVLTAAKADLKNQGKPIPDNQTLIKQLKKSGYYYQPKQSTMQKWTKPKQAKAGAFPV